MLQTQNRNMLRGADKGYVCPQEPQTGILESLIYTSPCYVCYN